jgi:putative peptide maturation system protein
MNDEQSIDHLVIQSLALLRELSERGLDPQAAQRELAGLRERHPQAKLDLLWEREPYAGTLHYDLLVSHDGRNAVWLGWCPDRGVPWVLRGVHRHSEADLVRVNGETLRVGAAMQLIDYIWADERIIDGLVDSCLIRQALVALDVAPPSDAELQRAVDEFRRRHGLSSAYDTMDWLARRGMSYEQLEFYVADSARVRALRSVVVGDAVQGHFERHRSELRRATLLLATTGDRAVAEAIAESGGAGQGGFVQAAVQHQAGRMALGRPGRETLELVVRQARELPEALAAAVFATEPGTVVGPVAHRTRYHVAHVVEHHEAVLDDACAEAIAERLFGEWLEAERRKASVEWLWGRE